MLFAFVCRSRVATKWIELTFDVQVNTRGQLLCISLGSVSAHRKGNLPIHIYRRHLLSLVCLKADNHFTVHHRVEGCVCQDMAVRLCIVVISTNIHCLVLLCNTVVHAAQPRSVFWTYWHQKWKLAGGKHMFLFNIYLVSFKVQVLNKSVFSDCIWLLICLQCFDTVGWASAGASSL